MKKRFLNFLLGALLLGANYNRVSAQCTALPCPYFEGFSSITFSNQLPSCWTATNLGSSCLTYTGTNNVAAFVNSQLQAYFISPAITVQNGNTYALSLKYLTDIAGAATFTNVTVYYSATQSTVGMTSVGSFTPVQSNSYLTWAIPAFSIPANGNYYFIIMASANQTSVAASLSWDDFSLKANCAPVPILGSTTTIFVCPLSLAALSIPSYTSSAYTYSWSSGATTFSAGVSPTVATTYTGIASYSATGCPAAVQVFSVVPDPSMITLTASSPITCAGYSIVLVASGAMTSYTWGTGQNGPVCTVTPQASTTYTVWGSNLWCTQHQTISVTALPSPTVDVSFPSQICRGDKITLTASGAVTYSWSTGPTTSSISVTPSASATFSVKGIGGNACTSTRTFSIDVVECTGIPGKFNQLMWLKMAGETISVTNNSASIQEVFFYSAEGKQLLKKQLMPGTTDIDLSELPKGLLIIQCGESGDSVRQKFLHQ